MISYIATKTTLTFTVDDPEAFAEYIAEKSEEFEENIYSDDCFIDAIEPLLCNGLNLVQPEHIGALTDSLLLSESFIDDETPATDEAIVYWYPYYAIRSPLQDLIDNGNCTFTID